VPGADPTATGEEAAGAGSAGADGNVPAEEEDWEKEESYLQTLVDKLQDKVDKEIARTLKVGPLSHDRGAAAGELVLKSHPLPSFVRRRSNSRSGKPRRSRHWTSRTTCASGLSLWPCRPTRRRPTVRLTVGLMRA